MQKVSAMNSMVVQGWCCLFNVAVLAHLTMTSCIIDRLALLCCFSSVRIEWCALFPVWQTGFCKLLCVGSGTSHDLRRERSYSFVGKSDMDEQEVAELIETRPQAWKQMTSLLKPLTGELACIMLVSQKSIATWWRGCSEPNASELSLPQVSVFLHP